MSIYEDCILTMSQVKAFRQSKFVKVNGEYRFGRPGFKSIALLKEGEQATSAGTIIIEQDSFRIIDSYSFSLKIVAGVESAEELEVVLGKTFIPNRLHEF